MNMPNMKKFMITTVLPSFLVAFVIAYAVTVGIYYSKPHIPPWEENISEVGFPKGDPGETVLAGNHAHVVFTEYEKFADASC